MAVANLNHLTGHDPKEVGPTELLPEVPYEITALMEFRTVSDPMGA